MTDTIVDSIFNLADAAKAKASQDDYAKKTPEIQAIIKSMEDLLVKETDTAEKVRKTSINAGAKKIVQDIIDEEIATDKQHQTPKK